MKNDKLYRPAVGILIYKKNHGFWTGKRLDQFKNAWQMPQGGIEDGETAEQAMSRELFEETNITSYKIIAQYNEWLYYDLPENIAKKFWHGKFVGQKQKWFLLEFTGSDTEINIHTEHQEFSEWSWHKTDFILNNIVEFKKDIYQQIFSKWNESLIY